MSIEAQHDQFRQSCDDVPRAVALVVDALIERTQPSSQSSISSTIHDIPYRESVVCRLLMDELHYNSAVIWIGVISPASWSFDLSLRLSLHSSIQNVAM
jgi:hypothetical protein